jgi:hypothetical protein
MKYLNKSRIALAFVAALVFSPSVLVPPAMAAVCTSVNAVPAPPVVTGTAQGGSTFQVATSGPIAGATNSTYVPVNVGNTLVSVTATNSSGSSSPATSTATAAVTAVSGSIPVNTALPTISGTAQVGQPPLTVSSNGTWTNTPTSYTYQWNSSASGSTAGFTITGGKIIAPNGTQFVPRGVVIFAHDLPSALTSLPNTAPLTTLFPGTNMVRIFYSNPSDMSFATLQTYINALTAAGIVVELQDYTATFCVLTGTALTNSVNLIGSYAAAYKNNPYVWFASQNEPALYNGGATACSNGSYNLAAVTTEQLGYYNAVRAAGNNNIVILSASGNPLDEQFPSTVALQYAGLSNAIWDLHYYNWMSNFATDVPTNAAKIAQDASQHQVVTDTNGVIPVIIAEYGDSSAGVSPDPGWQATITAVNTTPDGEGSLAWNWNSGGTADILRNGNTLTAYGQLVAQYILAGPSPPIAPSKSGPISGATASTYAPSPSDVGNTLTVSVTAHNATGASAPATSVPTSAVLAASTGGGSTTPRTSSLLSIFGISGHVGNYTDNSHTVADAAYLGIGKWRDGISGLTTAVKTIYQGLVNEGIQIIGLPWLPTDNTFPGNVAGAESVAAMGTGALFAVEGPNEPSISTFTYNGFNSATTWQGVSQWQSGWYSAVRADAPLNGVPVSTPTLVGAEPNNWGLQYLVVPAGPPAGVLAAAGLQYADIYNMHLYPMQQGTPSAQSIDLTAGDQFQAQQNADFVSTFAHGFAGSTSSFVNSQKRIITEFGYQTGTPTAGGIIVDVPTQGKDELNAFMNAWNEGYSAICIYTFYPFPIGAGDGNEIFTGPGSPKASATYIHNFTTALKDAGATAKTFPTSLLNYTLSGLPSTAKALLFQKSTGAFEIVIWNNVTNWNKGAGTPIAISPTPVSVNFPAAHGTVNVYDPTSGAAAIATAANANAMNVSLKDYPIVVEVIN